MSAVVRVARRSRQEASGSLDGHDSGSAADPASPRKSATDSSLRRKWREVVQHQRKFDGRGRTDSDQSQDSQEANAAHKDWEDIEDPRRTNSMRNRSLRLSARLRRSMAIRRRPTSAPEGKAKRKLMVRFNEQVDVLNYDVPSDDEDDEDGETANAEEEFDEEAEAAAVAELFKKMGINQNGRSRNGSFMKGWPKMPRNRGSIYREAEDKELIKEHQKARRKAKRRAEKRLRSLEYLREVEFFDSIQDWCRRELTDATYAGAPIEEFLPQKRAVSAREHHISSYEELVRKCRRFVDERMYEPSSLEQDNSAFAIHTEEIIASLVRDCLEGFLKYRIEKTKREMDALCHDCFYIAREIVLERRTVLQSE
mmetsp:Transcript_1246/g.3035  ORF Transcript_1246/g.3035 Transcript_1246/m.3035 type:complete len:368 (-) Transcript_1246:481-1584(-)|eukprot:CAMPEP_0171487918 /NCGR_PEP_ID=MMETSP0958-20121227/1918_1 /TAXON_ID=87120 /ORGANISM="Aurantiochytrium limacinum, Strain ATCCMYA-1381" /LENGTH=367 /DNA_ID=CAMNT_0012020973 /DNA_START=104 /DNA_END=1207 /DNA_ORIENTATION=+